MANLFNNIKLMDLMNIDNETVDDLYTSMKNNLIKLYDSDIYPVHNDEFFDDFIERFVDRYLNRYISFDTYGMFYIKLKYVLEQNRAKYRKIYESSLLKIEPLLTFSESEKITDNKKSSSENISNSTNNMSTDSNNHTSFTRNESGTNGGSDDFKQTTIDIKSISASTSNPKSQSRIATELNQLDYIDNENIATQKNDYETKTTIARTNSSNGGGTDDSNGNTTTTGNANNTINFTGSDDSIITRIKSGFNGSQVDLLRKYNELIFDVNGEIINDIERNHLFMSTLC